MSGLLQLKTIILYFLHLLLNCDTVRMVSTIFESGVGKPDTMKPQSDEIHLGQKNKKPFVKALSLPHPYCCF